MTPGVHRVRRQSWRVAVRSAEEAFAVRAQLRVAVEHELRPAFGRAFDRVAPDAAIVHIAKLELRLRVASLDALPGALEDAIERELRLQPPAPPREAAVDRLQVLLDYLDTGTLAWHAAQDESAVVAAELRATLVENLEPVARRGPAAGASFEQAVQFYLRLLALLAEEKWLQLVAPQFSLSPEALDVPAATAVIAEALREDIEVEQAPAEGLRLLRLSPRAAITALTAMRPSLRHKVRRIAALVLAASRVPDPTLSKRASPLLAIDSVSRTTYGEAGPELKDAPEPPAARHQRLARAFAAPTSGPFGAAQTFALMAGNAGLVLLHPFLPQLFKACRLFWDRQLHDQGRAAALLHWLATGSEDIQEFELGFVKLLIGLRPQTPLAVGEGLLGAREREEGEALLAAVTGHWKALGKTSADGLRVAFLQRRGALREEEAGWRLQLEPESFDVLLGRLPWGFATVKLPWMTRPLYTDWPTP
jgi:hypothetical protein